MKLLSSEQAAEWRRVNGVELDVGVRPFAVRSLPKNRRFSMPKASQYTWLARFIASELLPWDECLFLVTAWGIWNSSENWHMYYKLRESYGHHEPIFDEVPAHLFQSFENHDLSTFIQVALYFGWDFYVLTNTSYKSFFASHDEWIEFRVQEETVLETLTETLRKAGLARQ